MKFRQAFSSSLLILCVGLLFWYALNIEISLLGHQGVWSIVIGALGGAVLYVVMFYITKLFWVRLSSIRSLMSYLHSVFKEFSWFSIIVISIMAGLGEELLVRGVIQNYLVSSLSPLWGIVLASLIFGLMHYLSKAYVLATFALGLVFGLAYYVSNSLLMVMAAHAVYDVFAFAVIVKYPKLLNIDVALDQAPLEVIDNQVSRNQ